MAESGEYRRFLLTLWRFLLCSGKLPGGDADEPFEVPVELTLVAEADLEGDLDKRELPGGDESLGALDALVDDELMRRQAGRLLEQPGEVEFAQVGHIGKVCKGDVLVEMGVDVFLDRPQRMSGQSAACPADAPVGTLPVGHLSNQLDDQHVRQRLGTQPPARTAGNQLAAKGREGVDHLGARLVVIANRKMNAGRVEIERLFSHFGDQGRRQLVVSRVGQVARVAPPPPALDAGRQKIHGMR